MAVGTFVKPVRAFTWSDAGSTDWDLVQQCITGDELAGSRVVTDYQRMVYQLVLNQASNRQRWWRRRFRSHQVALDEHVGLHGDLSESRSYAMPDRVLQQNETSARVWRALSELPFDQRAAIILREIDGLSYDEIAESLGIAVGTVKSRLARARLNLRGALREPQEQEAS